MRSMRAATGFAALLLTLGLLAGSPVLADDVYLKNGRSFTGVVAEVTNNQVRIELPGGSISLPLSAVDRVEKAATSLEAYLERKREIESREAHGERRAADWLDLARWARAHGMSQGARQAALAAAEIDPRDPGLPALLRPLGYVYEERLDRWIPYDDSMRLHGLVQSGGQWMSREEAMAQNSQNAQNAQSDLQLQTAIAAQQAAVAATEARDLGLMAAGGGGAVTPDTGSGSVVGGYFGSWGWPGGYGGIFTAPGLAYGLGRGSLRSFAHRGQFRAFGGHPGPRPGAAIPGRTVIAPRGSAIRHR
jgi:hypothetical protein